MDQGFLKNKKFFNDKEIKDYIKGMKESILILFLFNMFLVFNSMGRSLFTFSVYYSIITLIIGIVCLFNLLRTLDMAKFFAFEAFISFVTALTCIGISLVINEISVLSIMVTVFGWMISGYLAYRVVQSSVGEVKENGKEVKVNYIIPVFSFIGIIMAKIAIRGLSQVSLKIAFEIGISFMSFLFAFNGFKNMIKHSIVIKGK